MNPFLDPFTFNLEAPSCPPPLFHPYDALVPWYNRPLPGNSALAFVLSHRTHCRHVQVGGKLPSDGFSVRNRVVTRADMVSQIREPETVYLYSRIRIDQLPLRISAVLNSTLKRREEVKSISGLEVFPLTFLIDNQDFFFRGC